MELNYLGRYRSLLDFKDKILINDNFTNQVFLGRFSTPWSDSIDQFNPTVKQIGLSTEDPPQVKSLYSALRDENDQAIGDASIKFYIVDPSESTGSLGTVEYGGQNYYYKNVITDIASYPNNGHYLNLYIEIRMWVNSQDDSFSFRQIGFGFTSGGSSYSFCYENIQVQTVNEGTSLDTNSGLILKLVVSF